MSMGLPAYTSVGTGTLQANASLVTAIAAAPNASTLPGDLVVIVVYGNSSAGPIYIGDAGDGWKVLDHGYDATNIIFIALLAAISPRSGGSGWAGCVASSSTYYTAQTQTFRLSRPGSFDLGGAKGSNGWFFDSASATALDAPLICPPGQQVLDVIGRGYYNSGTTTTVGTVTNFTERFDTGQTNPGMGVVLNDRTAAITGAVQCPSVTSALAVAKTMRSGVRAMIPIVGNTLLRGRMQGNRRLLG
jgi:hypothetical protein